MGERVTAEIEGYWERAYGGRVKHFWAEGRERIRMFRSATLCGKVLTEARRPDRWAIAKHRCKECDKRLAKMRTDVIQH